jgi:uncharacterized protein YjbI with pentapeptide repeats
MTKEPITTAEGVLAHYSAKDLRAYLCDVPEVDLRKAVLRGADLREANLGEADLRGADLRLADLREAKLFGADLREADLTGADLPPSHSEVFEEKNETSD